MSYTRGWSSKHLMVDARTIDDMVAVFQAAAEELEAMRSDGVELLFDEGVGHGFATLATDKQEVAEKYGFLQQEEDDEEREGLVMSPCHPAWSGFCEEHHGIAGRCRDICDCSVCNGIDYSTLGSMTADQLATGGRSVAEALDWWMDRIDCLEECCNVEDHRGGPVEAISACREAVSTLRAALAVGEVDDASTDGHRADARYS